MCIRNILCRLIIVSTCLAVWAVNVRAAQEDVKVGVFECPPFVIKDEGGTYSGLNLLLLERIAEQNQWKLLFTEYDLEGLLKAVSAGGVNIGASCLSITPEREKIFDFSHSFYETHLAIAVRQQGYLNLFINLVTNREFLSIILIICGSACVIGGLFYLLESRVNDKIYSTTTLGSKLTEGFILGLLFITRGPFNYYEFKTLTARVFTVLIAVGSTFFIASITAILASTFTLKSLHSDIKTPGDLVKKRVGALNASTSSKFLTEQSVYHLTFDSIDELIEALDAGRLDAVVSDDAILRYYIKTGQEQGQFNTIDVLPYRFKKQNYGFALNDDSQHIEQFNRSLLTIRNSSEWLQALQKTFGE